MKAIIFDMDGVLIDSPSYNQKSFNKILERYGVQLDDTIQHKYLGRSLRDSMKIWEEIFDIKISMTVEEFSKEATKTQLEIMKEEIKPDENIQKLIRDAKENNIKIAVATSSTRFRAEEMLKIIMVLDKLDTFITAEDVEKHKPAPDIFLKAAEELNVSPNECVVIEDALNGIEAAKAANMKAIGRVTKFHSAEEFNDADMVFKDFSELNLEKIESLFE